MEIIKRKILLENSIDRNYDSKTWGKLSADTFYINIFLKQSIDDMGLFSDIETVEKSDTATVNYDLLTEKLGSLGIETQNLSFLINDTPYPNQLNASPFEFYTLRYPAATVGQFYNYGNNAVLTGATDSKLEDLRSYKRNNQYPINFVINSETYVNFEGDVIDGVDLVSSYDEPKVYVFDTPQDNNLGTDNQVYGLQYKDFTGTTRSRIFSGDTIDEPLTIFRFKKEGWNETNTSLSAITKEEYLFGITSVPEVKNDVFIDRGTTSVLDKHLRLSEISNIGELEEYGNGFYILNKE
jgi:hypothetical protein